MSKRRRIPVVRQTAQSDCAAACLTMVLACHGKVVRLDEVRRLLGIGRDGADALTLVKGARFHGLRARGVKVPRVEDLRFLERGSVLHWGFHHYVVFERIDGDRVRIVDPGTGRRVVTLDDAGKTFVHCTRGSSSLEPERPPRKSRSPGSSPIFPDCRRP